MFVGIAYAIGATDLQRIVDGLVAETLAPLPSLGLKARAVDRQLAAALGLPAAGLLVDGVAAGGLAKAAGLTAGDVILALDDVPLATPGDLAFAVERAVPAGAMAVDLLRDGKALTLSLSLLTADEPAAGGIRLREVARALPETVASYRLSALGLLLDDNGVVTGVTDNSPALFAGLALGDRILTVNGATVDLDQLEVTEAILILVAAPGGETRHVYLDPWGAHDAVRPVGGANVLDPDVVVF
jgi:serine protease Do